MKKETRLWLVLGLVVGTAFTLLGLAGRTIYREAPPIPERVVSDSGRTLMTREEILDGQQVWQSIGGQQVGTVWGHGAYQAPDWSADWLHREATGLVDLWSVREHGRPSAELPAPELAALQARARTELRTNRYDTATGVLHIGDDRALAMAACADHYTRLFGGDPSLSVEREHYALSERPIQDPERLARLSQFFFWTSWACVAERPGSELSYTGNWPHEPLVGNVSPGSNFVWSVISIVLLIAGAGALIWYFAARKHEEEPAEVPRRDPLDGLVMTPSMRATGKYALIVVALLVLQVLLGALTAHYTIEGQSFFGIPLATLLPYAVARTWHLQTGVYWIATAFLGAGLFLAPMIGGREPKHQRLGVNVLFGALLVVVFGSMAGEYLSVHQKLSLEAGAWFGQQGYEYVDLGRAWQIALFAGLLIWLVLMLRGVGPALRRKDSEHSLVTLLGLSIVAIGLFYGAGLFYSARSHLSVAEYWRWWVVHLWVEGFFEVFATGVLAFLFSRLGLVRTQSATRAFLASTTIFLLGGIPGTLHHLYFSGTPVSVTAIGALFSALEVVPLVLIGREAVETLRHTGRASWMQRYRWPLRFFVAVAFWNLVGAGVFGFLINPPIALYYLQGLNTTPVHGHTALFGVYGMLSLGLVLFMLRRLAPEQEWKERALSWAFWSMNAGLVLMVALSILPIGISQAIACVDKGLWYARSAEFLQQPFLVHLRWMRAIGDSVFLIGVGSLVWFVAGLKAGWSLRQPARSTGGVPIEAAKSA